MTVLDYSAEEYLGGQLQTAKSYGKQSALVREKVDAVIIGAGPGGLVTAMVLAEAGLDVVVVEGGSFWPRGSFKRRQSWAAKHLMQDQGTRVSMGNAFIPVASGRGVGGGTLVNSAICFRAPDFVLDEWVERWGLDYFEESRREELFGEVERAIGVGDTPEAIAGENSLVARRGFRAMGFQAGFMPRNAPGCVGCGTCQTGCPTGGKATADLTYLPRMLRAGGRIFADTRAEEIEVEGGRARGVRAVMFDPESREALASFVFEAEKVIVAAGAINTPVLLLKQGLANSSGQVGRNLHLHPTCGVVAKFEDPIRIWSGATQGYYAHMPDDPEILLETFSVSPDVFLAQIAGVGDVDPGDFLRDFRYLAGAGLLIRDSSSGRVQPGKGQGVRISYRINSRDLSKLTRGLQVTAEMFFAAGSRAVMPLVKDSRYFRSLNHARDHIRIQSGPKDFRLYSSHPMGTCRIGEDPNRAVVRPRDGRSHDTEGLYVVDSSLFPSALGANPQVTIMAQALALSRRMAAGG